MAVLTAVLGVATLAALALGARASGQEGETSLRVAILRDYANLSVYTAGASDADPYVGLVYDTLFSTPYVQEPEPLLAESAEPGLDNRTWTVELRDGVSWHDGERFTAEDVVFSFEFYRDGEPNRWTHHASESPDMARVEALDDLTVRITRAQPCPTLAEVTLADLPILPEHVWSEVEDPATFDGVAIGTGPYRVERHEPGEHYELAANERYFAGDPVADSLVLPIIPDPSSAFLALRSGQVDAVSVPMPPQLVESFEANPEVDVVEATPLSDAELVFNMDREPFDSTAFRRAVMLAIDKDRLLETVLLGRGISGAESWPHPESPWTGENPPMPHDPEQARRLVAEEGFEGTEMEILIPQQDPTTQRATELVTEDLRAVGIDASARAVDQATIFELAGEGRFDAYVWAATAHALSDPTQLIQSFQAASYLGTYDNPEVAGLLEEAQAAGTVEEFRSLISRTHELLPDDPPVIPFYYPEQRYGVRPAAFDGGATATYPPLSGQTENSSLGRV
ncbi:MAG: ABC transporter substrate-binding protein [Solirubrobacterales bacterium]